MCAAPPFSVMLTGPTESLIDPVKRPGDTRRGPAGYVHSVAHGEDEPAVSIHCYSPPLMKVGQYRVDPCGVLRRDAEHGRRELVDETIARVAPELV